MQVVEIATLKSFDALAEVPDEQLQWLIDKSETNILKAGDFFIKPEDPLTGPHFIIYGNISGYYFQNGSRREITTFGKGNITGYLPYSRGRFSGIYMQADDEVQGFIVPYR